MKTRNNQNFLATAVVGTPAIGAIYAQTTTNSRVGVLKQDVGNPTRETADRVLYQRAFEVALWAMPAADSFATRVAVIRDLNAQPNDVAINTKPLNSDAHLIARQTQTPYLQGAIDLRNCPVVVEVPLATAQSHFSGPLPSSMQTTSSS